MKIVLFNGPPRSGKDTCVDMLSQKRYYKGMKLAEPLKLVTHALYGLWPIPDNYYEKVKDDPNGDFFGKTPREAYIEVSENCVKPYYGNDWWGRVLVSRIKQAGTERIALSDCGFADELNVLTNEFGPSSVLLVRLHRQGCDFSKDSRSYLYPGGSVAQADIHNDDTIEALGRQVFPLVDNFTRGKHD